MIGSKVKVNVIFVFGGHFFMKKNWDSSRPQDPINCDVPYLCNHFILNATFFASVQMMFEKKPYIY